MEMEITLEAVEQLRAKANVSYAQAKEALQYSGGDMLDALIYLEEMGSIPKPDGGAYSTRGTRKAPCTEELDLRPFEEQAEGKQDGPSFFARVRFWLLENELEIWHRDKPMTSMPVLVLILLVILAAWAVIPLAIISLFCGCRYRFSGPDLDRDDLNNAMGTVADSASDLGHQIMDELRRQQEKHQNNGAGRDRDNEK